MKISDALSGSAGLAGIHWMFNGSPRKLLRREINELLAFPSVLGSCRLLRARFTPGRRLQATYDAHIRIGKAPKHSVRALEVTWRSKAKRNRRLAELAAMEAEAGDRGLATPFRKLAAANPELGMRIEVSPLDQEYPQLVRLCDPSYVRDMIASAHAANGRSNSSEIASRYSVTFIRYRPGNKHVLRYEPLETRKGQTIFAKLYRANCGKQAFFKAQQVADWLERQGTGVRAVRPLAYVPEDKVVLYPRVVGTPLSKCLRSSRQNLGGHLKELGQTLFALHHLPLSEAGPLAFQYFAAKIKEKHFSALHPRVSSAIDALFARALELYERLPQEPPTFTWGDFKADHVWITRAGLTLIDFDTCKLSDPASDVGKFLADLRFWCTVYRQYELRRAQEEFLAGYCPNVPAERLVRARVFEAVKFAKLVVRRVGMFEHDWAERTEHLIGDAGAVLKNVECSLGVPRRRKKRVAHEVS